MTIKAQQIRIYGQFITINNPKQSKKGVIKIISNKFFIIEMIKVYIISIQHTQKIYKIFALKNK